MREAAPDTGEAALLARLRRGEEGAFETLVRENGCRMLAIARRFVRDEAEAQDVVQDAFASAFGALVRFQGEAKLSTWLHRITVNCALMRLRTRRRRPEVLLEDLLPRWEPDGHPVEFPVPWREVAEDTVERSDVREAVLGAIDRLPETSRNVLMMRDIEELDTATTAELLGVTENAVKIRLHRARQALRQVLDPVLRSTAP